MSRAVARLAAGWRPALLATLAGLVLAGIVHIVTILLIPHLAERNAAHAYAARGGGGRAELVSEQGAERSAQALREDDPATVTAVCDYDLSAGPLRVVAKTGALPLALTLHRHSGGVIYAITDRAAIRGMVEFVVMTEEQRDERIARDDDGTAEPELRVVSDTTQGLIVVRVLAKRASDRADAQALATGVACGLAE